MFGRVIKWEGDPPVEPEAYVNPEAHPKCVEVVEFADGEPVRVTYQRNDNGTD